MKRFLLNENKFRAEAYKKNTDVEEMIRHMNDVLATTELYIPSGIERPTIFIFGLPRSGTTLIYQLVSQCLDIGYINNLMARFWRAPIHGITLSQEVLLSNTSNSYESDLGRTNAPNAPHEFSYFWQENLLFCCHPLHLHHHYYCRQEGMLCSYSQLIQIQKMKRL